MAARPTWKGYLKISLVNIPVRVFPATDAGATRLGEIGIGTNFGIDRAIGAILFDEKIGGTVHLALGSSFKHLGGRNESGLHWDLVCDLRESGEVYADGELIWRDGTFVREPESTGPSNA